MTSRTYSCPACNYDIHIPRDCIDLDQKICLCDSCEKEFDIEYDAEQEDDGRWRDWTTLTERVLVTTATVPQKKA